MKPTMDSYKKSALLGAFVVARRSSHSGKNKNHQIGRI